MLEELKEIPIQIKMKKCLILDEQNSYINNKLKFTRI